MMEDDITCNHLTRAPQLQLGIVLVYTTSITVFVFIKGIIIIISNEAIHIHAATITANIAITDITVITTQISKLSQISKLLSKPKPNST